MFDDKAIGMTGSDLLNGLLLREEAAKELNENPAAALRVDNEQPMSERSAGSKEPPKRGRGRPKTNLGQISLVDLNSIKIGERHRKDLGDLTELAESIKDLGVLQPVGLTKDNELIFGRRRVEASRLAGLSKVPVRFIDIEPGARAEYDENECRKDFTPSERDAIRRAIGRKPLGDQSRSANLPTAEEAAKRAGFESKRTARNVATVVDHGAPELVEAMDSSAVSIGAAAVIATQSLEEQKRIVELPTLERNATVAKLRSRPKPCKPEPPPTASITQLALTTSNGLTAALQEDSTRKPPSAEPVSRPMTTAQEWARHLARQMSVAELREVRDAINDILATRQDESIAVY